MAPWPWSSSSSSSSPNTSTSTSTTPSSSSAQHAPTGAPLPSTSDAQTSQFTVADPILPPSTSPSSSPSTSPSAQSSNPSNPATDPTTFDLPPPAPLNLRPLFLTLLITCPILAALPPRKLDLYTLGLAGAWVISAEEVGRGQRFGWSSFTSFARRDVGDGRTREASDAQEGRDTQVGPGKMVVTKELGNSNKGQDDGEDETGGVTALARTLWMGNEKEGWKERRLAKEREDLAQGKGYADLIGERIEEVFVEGREKKADREQEKGG